MLTLSELERRVTRRGDGFVITLRRAMALT